MSGARDTQGFILVIDDDPGIGKMITALLRREGYSVLYAPSGKKALETLKEKGVDLILLDIMMPAMDGYQIFQNIKKEDSWKSIPIIFISAKSSTSDRVMGLELGAEDYLVKPFSNPELLVKVKLWVRIKRTEEVLRERNQELSALMESSYALTSSLDINELLRTIVEVSQRLWPADCANIMLINEDRNLAMVAEAGMPKDWQADLVDRPLKVGESLAGWVAQHKKVLSLRDPMSHTQYPYRSASFAKKYKVTGYLGIPLSVGNRLIGVLNFNSFQGRYFTDEQIALISAFAQHAAIAIDNGQAYAKMREAKDYLSNLIGNSQDAIMSVDWEGTIHLWNMGAEQIYGYSADEILGRSIDIILADGSWQEERRRLEAIEGDQGGVTFRRDGRRKNGSAFPSLITWSLIRNEKGIVQSISAIHKDISEISRMENQILESKRKFMAVVDGITDFLYAVDKDHRISQINRAYASYLKQHPSFLIGRTCFEVLRGESKPCGNCVVNEVLQKGGPLRAERKERGPNGQERIWEVSAFPVCIKPGEAHHVIYQLKDISEKKWMESQIIQAEKLSSLGQLAAGVAHEINNPLASLSIYTELLRRKERIDEESQKYLSAIELNVDRMAKITSGLLDYSRPAYRDFGPLDIREVINKALGILEKHTLFQDIEINREFANDLPKVRGEISELEQVFLNLVLNAAQSMPNGGSLWIKTQLQDDRFVQVSIRDNGSGISPEHLGRIFDPFFTTKAPGDGTGLGLSVVRGIIENHQGNIRVESELGKGTTFILDLPVHGSPSGEDGSEHWGSDPS